MTDAAATPDAALRVLVLAPVGRDARVTCSVLAEAGLPARACATFEELEAQLSAGAGALLVASEALDTRHVAAFVERLRAQPPWSDIPVILATARGQATPTLAWTVEKLHTAASVSVLERPLASLTLVSVVRTALRVRRRQYEMRDLLEQLRQNVERLDEESAIRDRFVALLAHDLRGPLAAAKMAAATVAMRPERLDERRDLALRIDRSIDRADRMIRDLLDANRLRAGGRLPLDLQPCDLVEVASDVVDELDPAVRPRVLVEAPERLEGIWAPDQLRRALWNLVTNAFKYGAADTPVRIGLSRAGDSVVVVVRNEGSVIAPEDLPGLFRPFARTVAAEKSATRGWGLGLTLVRGCAEAHGGTAEVTSSPEDGTAFILRLPVDARPFRS